eukprot:scaffold163631_cov31-Attheya_sp.AAC.2
MAGDSGLFFCSRHPCSIRAASQAFGRGDHPILDVLSSLDSFVVMLRLRMLGDLSATVCESMCHRHPCSMRAVSRDFFLSESYCISVCWVTYLRLFVKACAIVTLAQRERCLGNFFFRSHIASLYVGRLTCDCL